MKRQDLLTQEEFVPRRINQKFAKAENRIKYYNDKANDFRHSIAYLSKPLLKNIKILNELMFGKKEEVFHRQYLLGKGFALEIYTHIVQSKNNNQLAIHKYVIIPLPNDEIKIVNYKR